MQHNIIDMSISTREIHTMSSPPPLPPLKVRPFFRLEVSFFSTYFCEGNALPQRQPHTILYCTTRPQPSVKIWAISYRLSRQRIFRNAQIPLHLLLLRAPSRSRDGADPTPQSQDHGFRDSSSNQGWFKHRLVFAARQASHHPSQWQEDTQASCHTSARWHWCYWCQ